MSRHLGARIVRLYPAPHYPDRPEVLREPALLADHLPPAWRRRAEMAGVLGLFFSTTSPVRADQPKASPEPSAKPAATAVVAPLFQHGEGRGASGCVVVAPPALLSEEEAILVIREVFKEKGLEEFEENAEIDHAKVTINRFRRSLETEDGEPVTKVELVPTLMPLQADLRDTSHRIAIEFISAGDQRALEIENGYSSSGTEYNLVDLAAEFRAGVQSDQTLYVGTVYDPCVEIKLPPGEWPASQKTYDERRKTAAEEARKLLREQVLDFVKWLEAQGAM